MTSLPGASGTADASDAVLVVGGYGVVGHADRRGHPRAAPGAEAHRRRAQRREGRGGEPRRSAAPQAPSSTSAALTRWGTCGRSRWSPSSTTPPTTCCSTLPARACPSSTSPAGPAVSGAPRLAANRRRSRRRCFFFGLDGGHRVHPGRRHGTGAQRRSRPSTSACCTRSRTRPVPTRRSTWTGWRPVRGDGRRQAGCVPSLSDARRVDFPGGRRAKVSPLRHAGSVHAPGDDRRADGGRAYRLRQRLHHVAPGGARADGAVAADQRRALHVLAPQAALTTRVRAPVTTWWSRSWVRTTPAAASRGGLP